MGWRQFLSLFLGAAVSRSWRSQNFRKGILPAETPRLIEQTPRENGRMIEVPLNRLTHHRLETASPRRRISAFSKIRKIRHQQYAQFVRPIQKQRIVHLDVHAQKVEAESFGLRNVILQRLHGSGSINTVWMV